MLKDFALGYLYHVTLGVALAALIFALGVGGLRLCLWPRRAERADLLVLGLPVGIALLGPVCFLMLAGGVASWLGAALLLGLLIAAATWRGDAMAALGGIGRPLLVGAPAIALLALVNGFLMRGPSEKLGWSGYGDIAWFVGRMFNFLHQLIPPYEFLVEGERYPYAPHGPTMVGALLVDVPGFNPFLMISVTTPTFMGLAAIALLASGVATRGAIPTLAALAGAALFAGAFIYPSWLVESLPVAYSVPAVFAAARLIGPWPHRAWSLLAIGLLVGLSTFLTKVLLASFVIGALGFALIRVGRERLTPPQFTWLIATLAVVTAAYVAAMLWTWGWTISEYRYGSFPVLSHLRGVLADPGLSVPELGTATRDLALVLLLIAALRAERSMLTLLIAGGIVQYWISATFSAISSSASVMLVAQAVLTDPRWRRDLLTLLLPAAALLMVASLLRERFAVLIFGSMLAVMVLIWGSALLGRIDTLARRTLLLGQAACTVAWLGILGALAVEVGPLAAAVARQPHVLLPEAVDIWRQVRTRTPADALIFTDQTGEEISLSGGWNSLAASGGRQLYIAGWYHTRWRQWPEARAERYAINSAVLAGQVGPRAVTLSRAYGSYWAVVEQARPTPPGFTPVYANARYRLLRIDR